MQVIWDNNKLGWESLVLRLGNKCLKFYDAGRYRMEHLDFYEDCQNMLSGFTLTHHDGFEIWVGKKIHTIRIDFLRLSKEKYYTSDVITSEKRIVSELEFVEWKTLSEVIGYANGNNGYFYNIISLLREIEKDVEKQLHADMSLFDDVDRKTSTLFQINPHNIKVVELNLEKQSMKLVVTDIAMMIERFIKQNQGKIKAILG